MFEVLYHDEDAWTKVDEKTIREKLANTWMNVDPVIDELRAGYVVPTSFARYRFTEEEKR